MAESLSNDYIEQQLCREFETLMSLKPNTVTVHTSLPTLGVDSLRFVSLLLVIEEKFGVNLMQVGVKPDDLLTVRTLTEAIQAGRSA